MEQTEPCKKCGELAGWFQVQKTTGLQYFNSDGTPSHYVDELTDRLKTIRCANCDAKLPLGEGEGT